MIMEIFLILIKKELKSSFALKMILAKTMKAKRFSRLGTTLLFYVPILNLGKAYS